MLWTLVCQKYLHLTFMLKICVKQILLYVFAPSVAFVHKLINSLVQNHFTSRSCKKTRVWPRFVFYFILFFIFFFWNVDLFCTFHFYLFLHFDYFVFNNSFGTCCNLDDLSVVLSFWFVSIFTTCLEPLKLINYFRFVLFFIYDFFSRRCFDQVS